MGNSKTRAWASARARVCTRRSKSRIMIRSGRWRRQEKDEIHK